MLTVHFILPPIYATVTFGPVDLTAVNAPDGFSGTLIITPMTNSLSLSGFFLSELHIVESSDFGGHIQYSAFARDATHTTFGPVDLATRTSRRFFGTLIITPIDQLSLSDFFLSEMHIVNC